MVWKRTRDDLQEDHPTGIMFLDESGSIALDRFFAVGCLKLAEPERMTRAVQALRDKTHWYKEFHYSAMTRGTLSLYKELVNIAADVPGASFSCFIADRDRADPVRRFGSTWKAYEKLATQLIIGTIKPRELITVLADNYSTPEEVIFERDLKEQVNRRLGRLGVVSVCRLDSNACDALQVADLLTSAVAFEFRESAGLAGSSSPKAEIARHLRAKFGVESCLRGVRVDRLNLALYEES